jgi:hypothetical protein
VTSAGASRQRSRIVLDVARIDGGRWQSNPISERLV